MWGCTQKSEIGVKQGSCVNFGSAQNGIQPGVGVLKVWASIALKGCHAFEAELIIMDSLPRHVLPIELSVSTSLDSNLTGSDNIFEI